CLAGFAAWQWGDGARAVTALDRALQIEPDYRMGQLLFQAVQAGLHPDVWREVDLTACRGSARALDASGVNIRSRAGSVRNRRSTLTGMSSPGSPLARAVRAALVSLWSCLGAALAHVAGNGEPPPAIALVPVM